MRNLLLYVILVVVPVVGVIGVLRYGERLSAPSAVGGVWQVDRGGAACVVPGGQFEIVQSGEYLHVSMPGRSDLPGRLVRGELRARGGERTETSPGCARQTVELRVSVEGDTPDRLRGQIGVPGCVGCPLADFEAVRVVEPTEG